ncbi:hypothetical protein HYDPIDRAFT_179692 [Hydnomerulius pinastri MD-312]|nr:hypothetical protein HYDPIDRAFT_179692 [Hydnomerulius pinastri MD-312]
MAVNLSKKFIGAVKDDWQLFSDCSKDYTIGSPIGFGASSIVYAAIYNPPPPEPLHPLPCALKVLDLDSLPPHSLALLQCETQLMSLSKHPNVLRVRGTWIDGHKLHIALRLMNKGSAADVMQYGWPGGMEEEVVKCILKQALEGLNYLHINGFIHRDVKAANLLIDDDGTVLVGDLGVAASLADDGEQFSKHSTSSGTRKMNFDPISSQKSSHSIIPLSRPQMGKRKSFVGTPCWMAPELIQGKRYDAKADIWSFAITAIELTQGRPPRSRESAHTVLLQTVQGKPPTLDREGGVHRYSRAFKDIVDACLVKDPAKRPTAAQLLQTPFFKSAKKKSYLVGTILDGLPPLTMRQERRRRPASLMSQGTMDSWDFGSTTMGSRAPSIIGASPKMPQNRRTLSIDLDHDDHHEHIRTEIHPRFASHKTSVQDDHASTPQRIIITDGSSNESPPAPVLDILGSGKEESDYLLSRSRLPPLSVSPSTSSDSAQSSSSRSSLSMPQSTRPSTAPGLGRPRVQSPFATAAPVAIPHRNSVSKRKESLSSSSPPSAGVPCSAPPSTSPSFWNRLTRTGSRNVLADDGSSNENKGNGITRFLARRGSSSLAQHPIFAPS